MMWENYQLDDTILEMKEDLTLSRSDRVLVESNKGTLAAVVNCNGHREGLVFLGRGRLVVDTIVETEDGAVGKPVDRELSEPFLMLGDIEGTLTHLSEPSKEGLAQNGVKAEEFFAKAQSLMDKFSERRTSHDCLHQVEGKGLVFAFEAEGTKLDILVVNGSRLVFNSNNMSFVSNGNRSVLNEAGHVALTIGRRSVFIQRPSHHHGCC